MIVVPIILLTEMIEESIHELQLDDKLLKEDKELSLTKIRMVLLKGKMVEDLIKDKNVIKTLITENMNELEEVVK